MDHFTTAIVNMPLVFMSLLMNFFFIHCLGFSDSSEKIKQPVTCLLCTLVFCSVIYLISLLSKLIFNWYGTQVVFASAFYLISVGSLNSSMTTSVWLNYFYHAKIVPAKSALSVWVKKNVKLVIYVFWFFERIWSLADMSLLILHLNAILTKSTFNTTTGYLTISVSISFLNAMKFHLVFSLLIKMYFVISVCVMVWSTTSMSYYLIKHVRQMIASGQSLSSLKFSGQVRVVVTSILQALLYLLCGVWISYTIFGKPVIQDQLNENVHFTVCNVYMFLTTLNLCVGQTVFRQSAVDIAQALRGKILKVVKP